MGVWNLAPVGSVGMVRGGGRPIMGVWNLAPVGSVGMVRGAGRLRDCLL